MSLYDSLLERMEGRAYSNYFSAFCVFESHKSPALLVYEDGFTCLSCHKRGTLQYLDKKIGSHFRPEQMTRSQSKVLPRWRKWEQKWDDLEGIAHHAHQSLKHFPQFQAYFKRRKIHAFIEDGHLGYIDGWCLFPVYDISGKIVDIVVRATNGKSDTRYVVHPGNDADLRPLYVPSWERVIKADTVFVVYGIIDSISFELLGLPVVTGITGKSLSADVLKPLNKRFIIIPDYGEEREAHQLANRLGWRGKVKELSYPDDTKDTDDIRTKYGNEYLINLLGA